MRPIICLSAALLGACTVQTPETTNEAGANSAEPVAANVPASAPPAAPGRDEPAPAPVSTNMVEPEDTAPPREVVSEAAFSPASAQGAADVVQTYYALVEAKKYVAAHQLWGSASDLADGTFAAQFDRYREYHAEVDAPGRIEGAAGSSFVEVPVRTYGVTTDGKKFKESAVVTLRRVNEVPGSTTEQRRWHIAKIEQGARPH